MFDLWHIATIAGIFMIGGLVKGISGLGLPAVCIVLMASFMELHTAILLVLVPAFLTNVWQAVAGPSLYQIIDRFWIYFLCALSTVWIGVELLFYLDERVTTLFLGIVILLYTSSNLFGFQFELDSAQVKFWSPIVGAVNGIISGMTGIFMMPSTAFFRAAGYEKALLVQTLGILFSLLSFMLIILLGAWQGQFFDYLADITVATLFAFLGLWSGRHIQSFLSEDKFRLFHFITLALLGGNLIFRSIFV